MKNELNKSFVLNEFNFFKAKAKAYKKDGKYEDSLRHFKYAATIAWKFPILHEFIDEEIESEIKAISLSIIKNQQNPLTPNQNSNKILLYCGQIVDKGGLTEQYIHFFIEQGFELLVIVPDKAKTTNGKSTLNYISNHSNSKLYISKSRSITSKILEIKKEINKFNPSRIFLHFLPNDIEGYCSFFNQQQIRFYIVHNDHTFWIGKGCADYFIEFRHFGVSLSVIRRGIDPKKILHIPYYPIFDKKTQFQGFPFSKEGKVIGISGANLYKYYVDKDLKFFYAIKELILKNDNFIFCLCGWGDYSIVKNFITSNKLEERFYYLGKRSDFAEVVANSDILFESYPIKGGLVALYATNLKKPIIGIANYSSASGSLEDFLSIEGYTQPKDFIEFQKEANKLINSNDYRNKIGTKLANNKFNKTEFENSLKEIIKIETVTYKISKVKELKINDTDYLEKFLNQGINGLVALSWDKLTILKKRQPITSYLKSIHTIILSKKKFDLKVLTRLLLLILFGKQRFN